MRDDRWFLSFIVSPLIPSLPRVVVRPQLVDRSPGPGDFGLRHHSMFSSSRFDDLQPQLSTRLYSTTFPLTVHSFAVDCCGEVYRFGLLPSRVINLVQRWQTTLRVVLESVPPRQPTWSHCARPRALRLGQSG